MPLTALFSLITMGATGAFATGAEADRAGANEMGAGASTGAAGAADSTTKAWG